MGLSVNDGTDEKLSSLSYTSVDSIVNTILFLGQRTMLAKIDVWSAYWVSSSGLQGSRLAVARLHGPACSILFQAGLSTINHKVIRVCQEEVLSILLYCSLQSSSSVWSRSSCILWHLWQQMAFLLQQSSVIYQGCGIGNPKVSDMTTYSMSWMGLKAHRQRWDTNQDQGYQ